MSTTPPLVPPLTLSDDPRLVDTGWQPLTLVNGWTANGQTNPAVIPALRRIGKVVYVRVRNLKGDAATTPVFAVAPEGSRAFSADSGYAPWPSGPVLVSTNSLGELRINQIPSGAAAAGGIIYTLD